MPAAVLTEDCCTQNMKTSGLFSASCSPRPAQGERNCSVSTPGPVERWKDNSSPHSHASTAGPHAASNHLWAVTEPDWAERIWVGNFKTCSCFYERERICITHSDLMDFPMFTRDSPFCGHVQIMNLLCGQSLFPPCCYILFLVIR